MNKVPRQKARPPAGCRAVLDVEQPVIGPEWPMKPDRVVEARQHQTRVEHEAAMGDQRRIEQGEIRGIGEHALVQREIVAELARGPDPHLLRWRRASPGER